MDKVQLREFVPADVDWIVDQHQQLYRRDEGFDDSFGPLVRNILAKFVAAHDPDRERGWIAQQGTQRLGCIFCVRLTDSTAKLRMFLLTPQARGKGLGKQLLTQCMSFAKDAGYSDMSLWTHESHMAACALYRAFGWRLVSSKPVHSFGVDLVEQSWEIRL